MIRYDSDCDGNVPMQVSYLRAVLGLIEVYQTRGACSVEVFDDHLKDYMERTLRMADPRERCDIIPILQQLGYSVVRYDEDMNYGDKCPMQIGLCDYGLWHDEISVGKEWTYFPPANLNTDMNQLD
jgi:hypothetical protein